MFISRRGLLLGATSTLTGTSYVCARTEAGAPTKALILAMDVSGSMNYARYLHVRREYMNALRSKDVMQAILDQRNGVDILAFEWAFRQWLKVPWMRLRTKEDIDRCCALFLVHRRPTEIAKQIDCMPDVNPEAEKWRELPTPPLIPPSFPPLLGRSFGTFIGGAIATGVSLFLPQHARADKIIDISGDGPENVSEDFLSQARKDAVGRGIVINGLPIVDPAICYQGSDLFGYYEKHVIGGAGSFVEKANGMEDLKRALRMKFVRELS